MKFYAAATLLAAALRAQEPAGTIDGAVRDALTRAPVGDARIALHGPANRSATSASGGAFRFELLPPGDYALTVQKSGYLDSAAVPVHLKPGSVTETAAIDVSPLGGIEGKVLDEAGEPLPAVSVHLAGVTRVTGYDGRYTFEDLAPGSYPLAVGVPHPIRARNLARDPATGDYYGYAPAQYYPGADDSRLAIPVAVPAGARLRNFDLRLRRTLLVEFTGRLVDMTSRDPILNADVQLSSAIDGPGDPLWKRHSAAEGAFRFSLIQPGAYTLTVYLPERSPLPYLVPIQIGKAGAEDQPIVIPPFAHLQGSIQMPDPKARWFGAAAIRLTHRSGVSTSVYTHADGAFEFENVPPGEYQFDAQARDLRLPTYPLRRLSTLAIRFGSQNALRRGVTIAENGNPALEVQFTDQPAGIAGSVVDPDAAPQTRHLVTVAPLAPLRSNLPFANISLMVASPDFQFPELAPGEYQVTAVRAPSGPTLSTGVANFNRTCDETQRVTVREGAATTIVLRPCP